MILDSSALMAIADDEPDGPALLRIAASSATPLRMSAATWVEVGIVADARSARHGERIDGILAALAVEVVPVSARQAQFARAAYRRYGRGSDSRARLNFGDCFAYALATEAAEPLLYLGDDFGYTDVLAAR